MADLKLTDLSELISETSGDISIIVDSSEALPADKTKAITLANKTNSIKKLLAFEETPGYLLKVNSGADSLEFSSGTVVLIEKKILAVPTPNIDFTAIPAIYNHLELILNVRSTRPIGDSLAIQLQFNGDAGNNYDYEYMAAFGTTIGSNEFFGDSKLLAGVMAGAGVAGALAGNCIISFINYKGTSFNKIAISESVVKLGIDPNTGLDLNIYLLSGYWRNSAAINRINIIQTSNNYAVGSIASLYGIM